MDRWTFGPLALGYGLTASWFSEYRGLWFVPCEPALDLTFYLIFSAISFASNLRRCPITLLPALPSSLTYTLHIAPSSLHRRI